MVVKHISRSSALPCNFFGVMMLQGGDRSLMASNHVHLQREDPEVVSAKSSERSGLHRFES